ncbi:MAG TPA: MmgE/PrpD family protein [Azospirillaceae bacterium]|nr:MmgE/PrpD family protein [Azospirillaceae bacterium]
MSAGPTSAYAHWAATVPDRWPDALHRLANRYVFDVAACILAGRDDPATAAVRQTVAASAAEPCDLAGGGTAPAMLAALVNGTAAHALDFDDNFAPAAAHGSAVLVPALLAVAQERGLGLAAVRDAYIVGLEVMARVGRGVNPLHRRMGWHATSTVGALGTAAGVGRLLRLEPDRMRAAIALSYSMASGSMAQFGTQAKPLHCGLAAKAGVLSATLAAAGMEAAAEVLEGPYGMQSLMVGRDLEAHRQGPGWAGQDRPYAFDTDMDRGPLALEAYAPLIKLWPTCGSTHTAVQAALALRQAHAHRLSEIESVHVASQRASAANLPFATPTTAAQARFSMPFAVGVALRRGDIGLADFEPEALRDHMASGWPGRVSTSVTPDRDDDPTVPESTVTLRFRDGATAILGLPEAATLGSPGYPITDALLEAKIHSCCVPVIGAAGAEVLVEGLRAADDRPAGALTRWFGHRPDQAAPT